MKSPYSLLLLVSILGLTVGCGQTLPEAAQTNSSSNNVSSGWTNDGNQGEVTPLPTPTPDPDSTLEPEKPTFELDENQARISYASGSVSFKEAQSLTQPISLVGCCQITGLNPDATTTVSISLFEGSYKDLGNANKVTVDISKIWLADNQRDIPGYRCGSGQQEHCSFDALDSFEIGIEASLWSFCQSPERKRDSSHKSQMFFKVDIGGKLSFSIPISCSAYDKPEEINLNN